MTVPDTPDILLTILKRKRQVIAQQKKQTPLTQLKESVAWAPKPRGFIHAIEQQIADNKIAVIAEAKKASPSQGVIRKHFDVGQITRSYQEGGATCLSVLTDLDFFQGTKQHLIQARQVGHLPILRKDFIIDQYQIYESRIMGADCVLLIAAILSDQQLTELAQLAAQLELDVLLEVHDLAELKRALKLNQPLIGINNRNLHHFTVSLATTFDLLPYIPPDRIVVTESGITHQDDIQQMRSHGVNAFLIGETLMRSTQPGQALKKLIN